MARPDRLHPLTVHSLLSEWTVEMPGRLERADDTMLQAIGRGDLHGMFR